MLVLSAAAIAAGCGGAGPTTTATTAEAQDRIEVSLGGGEDGSLRISLDCTVADRAACSTILEALADARDAEGCTAMAGTPRARLRVSGSIAGDRVSALVTRRTDCEVRTYDRVVAGLGLGP